MLSVELVKIVGIEVIREDDIMNETIKIVERFLSRAVVEPVHKPPDRCESNCGFGLE